MTFYKYKYSPDNVLVQVFQVIEETKDYLRIVGKVQGSKVEEEMILYKDSWIHHPGDTRAETSKAALPSGRKFLRST